MWNMKGNTRPNKKKQVLENRKNRVEQNDLHCHHTTSSSNEVVIVTYVDLWLRLPKGNRSNGG